MTVPQRILLHIAAGAGLVIAVATTMTYRRVYDGVTRGELRHLETYVTERAQREELGFQQVQANLTLVRGQFLRRMEEPITEEVTARWNERFRLFADGAWRSREEFVDGRKYATLWANKKTVFTSDLRGQVLRAQELCDQLLPGWVDAFPSVYFVFPGWLNIGFDPRIANWVWDTPADYDPSDLEWFGLAMPASGKPSPGFAWTGVIEEPTTKNPIVSIYLPIIKDGRQLGSIGHDLFVNRLMEDTTRSGLSGARHVIFRGDGRLIAHPTKRQEILASKGELRMQDSGDVALTSLYRTVSARSERQFSGYDAASGLYFSVARLTGPEWFFLTTIPRDHLQQQAFASAQWVLWSGLASLALVLGFLATILRRQIALPLEELSRATRAMGAGEASARAVVERHDEFGGLANSFNDMAGRVASRDAELRQLNQGLEQRVTLRTSELIEANRRLDEGREEALQLLARERELNELRSDFVSLVSHEFRTPLEIIMSSVDNLDRYHDRLPVEKRAELLRTINKSVRRMSGMMEEVLVLGRLQTENMKFGPTTFELMGFCRRVCDEIESAMGKSGVIRHSMENAGGDATGDEAVLRHIFTNLLSNALKYSPANVPVDFAVRREGVTAIFRIADRGCGIPAADQKRLFQAFHRGSNVRQIPGTGLGLLIVRRCLDLHRGDIEFKSTEGEGTAFVVRLPLFDRDLSSP